MNFRLVYPVMITYLTLLRMVDVLLLKKTDSFFKVQHNY
jgi:hypothetical protein